MKKIIIMLAVSLSLVLAACTSGTSEQGESGIKDSIVIGFESDASTLLANKDVNYITDAQIRNIYDPLIQRNKETGEYESFLLESWENIDEYTWKFKLTDESVKFHSGNELNSDSVKFSIDFILDPDNSSAYLSRWKDVKEVNVINDQEFEIVTTEPFPSLIDRITEDLLILDNKYVEEVGIAEAENNPSGSGPYKFVEWSRDNHLKLEANEDYWAEQAKIKNLEFRYIPEFSSRMSAFQSGEIDLFKNVPVDAISKIESSSDGDVVSIDSSRINYLALNTLKEGPLQDEKVRQAINYAVDVDSLIDNVLNGYGTKITGVLSKLNSAYTETPEYDYNPEKAKELIEEAGYSPEDIKLTLDSPNGRYPMDTHVAQAIASQLDEIGIEVKVNVNEWGNHLEKIQNREAGDMFILGWGPAFTPQSTIENLFTKEAPYSSFYDEEIEKEIDRVNKTFDMEKRTEGYQKLQEVLVEKAVWVPLWQQADIYAVRNGLNFEPRVDESFEIVNASWEK